MGKIFDALEKSKEKHKSPGETNKNPGAVVNAKAENQAYASTPVSLSKDVNATDVSYQRVKKVAKLKKQDQAIPLSKNKISYDFNKIDKNLVALLKPQSFENEQFKMLRTNLLFPPSGRSPRKILVTSANSKRDYPRINKRHDSKFQCRQ